MLVFGSMRSLNSLSTTGKLASPTSEGKNHSGFKKPCSFLFEDPKISQFDSFSEAVSQSYLLIMICQWSQYLLSLYLKIGYYHHQATVNVF